ncbi:MAG: ribonuclease Z [Candidatus Lokiarchaeota archaeon]|nr:ribonuclease Z [Candidatus Lokiarchaeota archaeon]
MILLVKFLGTNGWYSTFSNTTCTLIDSDNYYIVFDAGDGIYKLDNYIQEIKPIIIFLSHTHLDHIIGLHILSKFRFKQEVKIYGYKGTRNALNTLLNHPFTTALSDLPSKIEICDFKEGIHNNPLNFTSKKLIHSDVCVGFKINIENRIISYCTDTGVCDNLYSLSENADLLISECSYKPGQEKWGWPHLKPEEIALVAKNSNVQQLILTHFDASIFLSMEERKRTVKKAKKIFPQTIAAYDGLELTL